MRRIFFWTTLASGIAAAYMMSRRGAPVTEIAKKAFRNPIGTLVNEFRQAKNA